MVGEKRIYENDVGVRFIVTVSLASNPTAHRLSDADEAGLKLYVKKPSGTEVVWTPHRTDVNGEVVSPDNPDYAKLVVALTYETLEGDLNESGTYKLHAYVTWANGTSKHLGQTTTFRVYKKFEV